MSQNTVSINPATLFKMVSQVAESLLVCPLKGFHVATGRAFVDAGEPVDAYAIALTSPQDVLDVVVACKRQDAKALAARIEDKPVGEITDNLVRDAMREWLNILAGQVKSLAALDHEMGLPRPVAPGAEGETLAWTKDKGLVIEIAEIDVALWLGLVGSSGVNLEQEA